MNQAGQFINNIAAHIESRPWREAVFAAIQKLPDQSLAAVLTRQTRNSIQNAWQFFLDCSSRDNAAVIMDRFDLTFLSLAPFYSKIFVFVENDSLGRICAEILRQEKIENIEILVQSDLTIPEDFSLFFDLIVLTGLLDEFSAEKATEFLNTVYGALTEKGQIVLPARNKFSHETMGGNRSGKKDCLRGLRGNLRLLKMAGFTYRNHLLPLPDTFIYSELISRKHTRKRTIQKITHQDNFRKRVKKIVMNSVLADFIVPGWFLVGAKMQAEPFVESVDRWLIEKGVNGPKMNLELKSYLVTPKGMVLLKMTDTYSDGGLLIKLPLNAVAERHAQLHCTAINGVVNDPQIPSALKHKIPGQLLVDTLAGQKIFVENLLSGSPAAAFRLIPAIKKQAVTEGAKYIQAFQLATQHFPNDKNEQIGHYIDSVIGKAQNFTDEKKYHQLLANYSTGIKAKLQNSSIPLVCEKGDYSLSNLLVDQTGNLNGVIDWDLSKKSGLPLIDLLNLLSSSARLRVKPQSFGTVLTDVFIGNNFEDYEKQALEDYCAALKISEQLLPSFYLLFWLTNIAVHSDYQRKNDSRWMRNNYFAVLDFLECRMREL